MIVSRRKVVRFKPVQGRKTGLQHRGTFSIMKWKFKFNIILILIRIIALDFA